MKIALDNRVLPYSGIGVYVRALASEYASMGDTVELYEDHIPVSRQSIVGKYVRFLQRKKREALEMEKWFSERNIDIYHATANMGVPFFPSTPVIVTIHDIIPHVLPKQYFSNLLERLQYEMYIRVSLRQSRHIITISEFSKQELIRRFHVDPEKISIIFNGYNTIFRKINQPDELRAIRKKYHLDQKYLLTIGGSEYRKNNRRLIQVFQRRFADRYQMVVIGGAWRGTDLSKEFDDPRIRFLCNVPIEDLVGIYNMAELFVFPSFYEGFGIPALEGMACCVPVVTSGVTSIPEICGNAATYFDPFDSEDIAAKIESVLSDGDLRQRMVALGMEKVKEYSWKRCAEQTHAIYQKVLEKTAHGITAKKEFF